MAHVIPQIALPTLLLLAAAASAAWQADSQSERIIAEALKPSSYESNLRTLTEEIGGRLPGTPAMDKAIAWAEKAMREAGAEAVHSEEFTMPVSWREGATSVAVSAPEKFKVRAVSVPWAPTKRTVHARVIDIGEGTEADFAKAGDVSGAVLLVHTKVLGSWEDLFVEYLKSPPVIQAATKGKAAAIAFMSTREGPLLYRHIKNFTGEIDRLPMVIVAREDGERMAKLLAAGNKLEMDLSISNKIGGRFRTANVVGEIRGTERPEEFVVLGAHLDSWELGAGALDNGCNSA
ncbi:MAG: M28 family peptidase, partial [Acidobacteriales bacterium]|nr:M28 family peptidase [Terriglobales bacterium]